MTIAVIQKNNNKGKKDKHNFRSLKMENSNSNKSFLRVQKQITSSNQCSLPTTVKL